MPSFELAPGAESDLEEIAHYTVETWGTAQARRYGQSLKKHCEAIGRGKVRTRVFLKLRPELFVSRCEHHFVFHLDRGKKCPLILAILHENMDLVSRIRRRLGS